MILLSTYTVWFGVHVVLGSPDAATVTQRALAFIVNAITIFAVTAVMYAVLDSPREVLKRYPEHQG